MGLRNGTFERETESLSIEAQNHIKARIDKSP